MSKVLSLAMDLMSRASLTPEDAGCQKLIADRLTTAGYDVEWFYCGEVSNVLITRGNRKPSIWFLGHTDVVPPGPLEEWASPPFEPEIRDGVLFGRGAADMKGAVAAMVIALEDFAKSNPDHSGQAGLLLTSDEEGVAVDGIRRVSELLKQRGIAPDHCLVGEPSCQNVFGDTVRIGRRGSIHAQLIINGIQGHTAFPHTLDNPVHRLAPFLKELVSTEWDQGDDSFPPTHCQIASINAGSGAENVTPGNLELKINFRNSPLSPSNDLRDRVDQMIRQNGIENFELQWRVSGEPFRSESGELRKAIHDVLQNEVGVEPEMNTGGGTSDGRFIAPLGSEVAEFGLLNASIHQVNENTSVEDLERLVHVYSSILGKLLLS
jgi:succinyl-diaminopimelate desuccinylase